MKLFMLLIFVGEIFHSWGCFATMPFEENTAESHCREQSIVAGSVDNILGGYVTDMQESEITLDQSTHFLRGHNRAGSLGLLDTRRGLVFPLSPEDRKNTACFKPFGYKENANKYWPNRGLGKFVLSHYPEDLVDLSAYLISGVEGEAQNPISEAIRKGNMDVDIQDTFGLILNSMGVDGLLVLGTQVRRSNKRLGNIILELSAWMNLFIHPLEVLDLGIHNPISMIPTGVNKGTPLRGTYDVPKYFQHSWSLRGLFSYSYGMRKVVIDPLNGLGYPVFPGYYGIETIMLPRHYKCTMQQFTLGFLFIKAMKGDISSALSKELGIPHIFSKKGIKAIKSCGIDAYNENDITFRGIRNHDLALIATTGLAFENMIKRQGGFVKLK